MRLSTGIPDLDSLLGGSPCPDHILPYRIDEGGLRLE